MGKCFLIFLHFCHIASPFNYVRFAVSQEWCKIKTTSAETFRGDISVKETTGNEIAFCILFARATYLLPKDILKRWL